MARSRHAAQLRRGDALIERGEHLYNKALAVLARAEQGRIDALTVDDVPAEHRALVIATAESLAASDTMILRAIREARPTLEYLAKMAGQLKDQVVFDIRKAPDYIEFRDALLRALQPYPETHGDVADAMLEFEARRTPPNDSTLGAKH